MAQVQLQQTTKPSEITSTLARLRSRIRWYLFARGMALVVVAVGIAYWISLLIDYTPAGLGLTDLPAAVRALMLLVSLGCVFFIAWRYLFQPMTVPLSDKSMAMLLERRFQSLGDSLLTSVELGEQSSHVSGYGTEMLSVTANQANQQLPSLPISSVLRPRPLLVGATAAGLFVISWLLFAALSPNGFWLSGKRLLFLSDEPWPRACHLEQVGVLVQRDYDLSAIPSDLDRRVFENGTLNVAKGTRLALIVQAETPTQSNPDRHVPKLCTFRSRTESGAVTTQTIGADGPEANGLQAFRYEGDPFIDINESLSLFVKGGDHRLPKHRIQVVEAPSIISTKLDCLFPEYLVDIESGSWTARKITWPYPDALPAHTQITLDCETNKPIAQIFVHRRSTDSDQVIDLDEQAGATSFELPLGELTQSEIVDIALLDTDDVLSTNQFTIDIRIAEDQVPRIQATMTGIGAAVTPNVRIPMSGTILDDYGVDAAWLEVQATKLDTFTVDVNRLPDNKFEYTLDFLEERRKQNSELLLEADDEQRLVLKVKGQDRFNLDGGSHIGESDTISLRIVSESELLAILNRAEVGQRQILEQIHREMQDGQIQILQSRVEEQPTADESESSSEESDGSASGFEDELTGIPLNRLYAFRAFRQAEKSRNELNGVYEAFVDIRLQLINNRIDAPQREERLDQKVAQPLQVIEQQSFPELLKSLEELKELLGQLEQTPTDLQKREEAIELANQSVAQAQLVIDQIDAVLVQLLDIEDDSRLMEIVRQMIKEQEELLKETEAEQKRQGLRDLIGK